MTDWYIPTFCEQDRKGKKQEYSGRTQTPVTMQTFVVINIVGKEKEDRGIRRYREKKTEHPLQTYTQHT